MEFGVRKKSYFIFCISNFVTFPLIGWYIAGVTAAIVGFFIAIVIDKLFPIWAYDLTWKDIDTALNNLYLYGKNPSDLCFFIGKRRIFVYRDEKGPPKKPIRIAVRIPLKDWLDIYTQDELRAIYKKYGGSSIFSKNRGPECYLIFIRTGEEVNNCREILKLLFEKSADGLKPDIFASSIVNSTKNIWIEHPQ